MSNKLRDRLEVKCKNMDIPLLGVAPAERWNDPPFTPWIPEEFRPLSIWPEVCSVIVIGLPIDLPIIETAPSIYYHELYNTVNTFLDLSTYRLARFLDNHGYPSIYVPRDGYGSLSILKDNPFAFFSHRHAAYLAGLGTFGVNNMLLTPEYGPRVRLGTIFTTAELPVDDVMDIDLCIKCMRCSRSCPVEALDDTDYPLGLTKKEICTQYNASLARKHVSPCGRCIKVCPIGRDRVRFKRTDLRLYDREYIRPDLHRAWKHVQSHGSKQV
ncbi:MAG: epoxyqueuosine reductase [Euryarchaeota archaeon]|nr:epoxyqueuosine reductase [Euryarchaeota archaeon]